MSLFRELKRRNVVRVGVAYVVLGWALAQVAEFAFETFGAPDWALKSVVIVLLLGLPLVLFLAWAFELTPEGIKRDQDVDHSQSTVTRAGRRIDRMIIAVLLVALTWFAWDRFFAGTDEHPASTAEMSAAGPADQGTDESTSVAEKSVAVLPFVAMSSGPDDGYFADGLTEEILNSLAGLPELLVTARTSAFSFKGKDLPIQEIAATLNVEHIVEGSVRRSGDRLRVTAQLIRADDGFHLWSETYDRDAGDTFTIQTDIAEKIALALDVFLDDDRRAAMATANVRNPEAFVAYQKGRELFTLAHNVAEQLQTLEKANAYFDEAIQLEPDFYFAHVARSDLYTHTLIDFATGDPLVADLDEQALADAHKALEENLENAIRLAPDRARRLNSEYDQALLFGNWRGLDRLTDAVLTQNRDCVGPDWIHLTSTAFGRAAEARVYYENLIACDPLGNDDRKHWATAALWLGQFDKVIEFAGSYDDSGQRKRIGEYIEALIAAGRTDEAQDVIETEIRSADAAANFQMLIAVKRGDAVRAREIIASSLPGWDGRGIVAAARLGDRDTANEEAALIDSRPFGYIALLQRIYFCNCGAPFDLEATPTLAKMLEESGLPWPPESIVDWPLKNW